MWSLYGNDNKQNKALVCGIGAFMDTIKDECKQSTAWGLYGCNER